LEQIELLKVETQLLEEENVQLSEVVDELFNFSSIIRIAKYNNVDETEFSWRKLKSASITKRLEIKVAPCPRYGKKNLYHHDAWRIAYPGVKLPETTTLVLRAA
jgi:hypothetical protein